AEMRERLASLVPGVAFPWVQTFHAACFRMLRQDIHWLGYANDFTIIDEAEQRALFKECLQELQEYREKPEVACSLCKQAKNSLRPPEDFYASLPMPRGAAELHRRAYLLYHARLREMNALDFEDLIGLCITLFREHPQVLEKYQQRFRYLMVDEYQDTNLAQYELARTLAGESRNLFVVG
ncbi:MAG: UvrD-helicase domain-containing protein, partial [Syntrophomonadaceae bacterium]|nr:UvrD-helicase domain-containing protein [Syntrophomonadaceae bacterium]